jgi:hypothetical protein
MSEIFIFILTVLCLGSAFCIALVFKWAFESIVEIIRNL